MENFHGFFPSSSSTLSASSLSLNMDSLGYGEFQDTKGNGFLGLMEEMEVPSSLMNVHNNINNPQINESFPHQSTKSFAAAGSTETDQVMKSGKKKGDKKIKKPRCAFQTRSQVDILDDGYRWRKYGQKAVKNNKFPRYIQNLFDPLCQKRIHLCFIFQ